MKVKTTLLLLMALCCSIVASAQCSGATFQEQNGIVVIQAENVSTTGSWAKQSSQGGFTGSGYLNWTGSEFFGTPGNGLIQYTVRINSPGTYRFNWRSKIGIGNNSTEHNDTWLRIPGAADFYAQKGSSRIYPRGTGKTPNPEGASSDGWFKVYMNSLNWTWSAFTSDFDGHIIYVRFATAGVYTIQLSARSRGHLIDRMVLYKESQYGAGQAQDLSRAETLCDGNPTPPPSGGGGGDDGGDTGGGGGGSNTAPTVNITSPSNGATIAPGSNVSVTLNSNDSDGNVVQHRVFVNGSLVDTDGAGYTPYVISNIASGSYTVRASVTDDDGAVANDEISFTVSGSSGGGGGDDGGDTGGGGSGGGTGNAAPSVNITSPANGANVAVGSNVSVNLSANDSDGSIAQHKIFVNGTLVDTDGAGYTPHIITGIAAGNYTIRAMVTDNDGATSEDSVSFTAGGGSGGGGDTGGGDTGGGGGDGAPTVSITSPSNGATVAVGSNVSVNLSANDADGSVVEHKIFVNGTLVDTDGANFTPHIIVGVAAGGYTVRAMVTDNDGNTGEATINFTAGEGSGGGDTGGGGGTTESVVFNLINPSNNTSLGALNNGSNIANGSSVNIQTSTSVSGVGSVVFVLSGAQNRRWVESAAPYALFGDFNGDYIAGSLAPGSYVLLATFYSSPGGNGSVVDSRTISFTVSGSGREVTDVKAVAYPNPTPDGTISVKFPRVMGAKIGYNLMSPAGQLIASGVIENGTESDAAQLTLPALQNSQEGIYYLIVTDGGQSYTIPVIRK